MRSGAGREPQTGMSDARAAVEPVEAVEAVEEVAE